MFRMNGMSRAHGCAGVTMFRMNGAFVCSCTNDTSAIHGGRSFNAPAKTTLPPSMAVVCHGRIKSRDGTVRRSDVLESRRSSYRGCAGLTMFKHECNINLRPIYTEWVNLTQAIRRILFPTGPVLGGLKSTS
jgi:hypothetical protein